jgi:16S rRNA (guanine(966)-N(2))-methyltransferase RsmD
MIRIIAGTYRSRKLLSPPEHITRPTKDRVREAIFSALGQHIYLANVLDLFAGSGVMGFEAISRGAQSALINDADESAYRIIKKNAETLQVGKEITLTQRSFEDLLKLCGEKQQQFSIIFLDPPYQTRLLEQAVSLVEEHHLLSSHGIIIVESNGRFELNSEYYKKIKSYQYGKTIITIGWKHE